MGQQPNVGADPINPAYYAGTACAEIIEHMPTNVGFAAKYAWRLGEKDVASQEAGKAIWYLERQKNVPFHNHFIMGGMFAPYANDRIMYAIALGKLDMIRSEIIGECVQYSIDGSNSHLDRAIELFRTYL